MSALGVTADFHGAQAHVLRAADGTEAWVVPSIGANCIALSVPVVDGRRAHLLSTPVSAEALRAHGTGSGFPILSPHPSGGRAPFVWRGREYGPPGKERLSGHGFASAAEWEVVTAGESELVCRLDTRKLGADVWWPWPFTLTARHRVEPGALLLELELESLHPEPAPVMIGLHPYHPLRLVGGLELGAGETPPTAAELVGEDEAGARRSCEVWVEADDLWDLDRERAAWMGPEGRARWALRRPRSLHDLAQTAAAAGVASADGRMPVLFYGKPEALRAAREGTDPAAPGGLSSGVRDGASGVGLRLETSLAFGGLAVYTPPGHAAVSLEPRSTLLDAPALASAQPELDTGLRAVEPGRPWRGWARLSLERAARS